MRLRRSGFLERLKMIVGMFLRHFRAINDPQAGEEERHLQLAIDSALATLEKLDTPKDLETLEDQVKQILSVQAHLAQRRTAQRLEALRKLIATVTSGLAGLSERSTDFVQELNDRVEQLMNILAEEQAGPLRESLQTELLRLKQMIGARARQEQRLTDTLRQHLKRLESELAEARQELRLDPLTGLHNRRALDARLREDVEHYTQHGGEFAVLLFDLDHFKQVNDQHGHLVGDRVLQALAGLARQVFRRADFLARYGGEEFLVIVYDTGPMYTQKIAERFRLAVAKRQFQYKIGQEERTLKITVSLGATQFQPGDTPESLIQRADDALYRAKSNGRNQVQFQEA